MTKCHDSGVAIHFAGAWEEIRTPDLRITNALLYRLSYPGATREFTRFPRPTQSRDNESITSASRSPSSMFVASRSLASISISSACIDATTR